MSHHFHVRQSCVVERLADAAEIRAFVKADGVELCTEGRGFQSRRSGVREQRVQNGTSDAASARGGPNRHAADLRDRSIAHVVAPRRNHASQRVARERVNRRIAVVTIDLFFRRNALLVDEDLETQRDRFVHATGVRGIEQLHGQAAHETAVRDRGNFSGRRLIGRAMERALRVAVDARVLARDTRGIGRYERAILRRLVAREDVILTLLDFGPFPFRNRRAWQRAVGSARFHISTRAGDNDVVWHPANGTFFPSRAPNVATIHDAVPFRYPDSNAKTRAAARAPFLRSVESAAVIVAVSEFGKSEIREVFGVPSERIEVIYHGVDPSFTPGDGRGSFLLFVGDPIAEPRKNFSMLYNAYTRAWPDGDGPPIVVAGPRAPTLPNVIHAGEIGDDLSGTQNERLRDLYRGARALALASYHETFGMPMVEAMACGTPVVASNASSLPEIGADAALFVPPGDAVAWAAALRRIVQDDALHAGLRAKGLERAREFDWDRSAEAHLELFRRAKDSRAVAR